MALDMTSADFFLKEYYNAQRVENAVYRNNPFLALVGKMKDFKGRNYPLPLGYANPQNRNATFSTAWGKSTTTAGKEFLLTRVSDYSIARIANETLEATAGDKGAFAQALTTEVDGAMQSCTNMLASYLWGDGTGAIGQVNAEPSVAATTVITLKEITDITSFEIGQTIVIYSATSGGTQRIYETAVTEADITAVDRDLGTITLDEAYTANGTIAADDYLFVSGDRGSVITGIAGWIPTTAPTSGDSHFGVDRSADTTRLAGVRYDGSGSPIEEAVIGAAARLGREGASPDVLFVSYEKFKELENALGSKVQYVDLKMNAQIGFQGITIHGPNGQIKVLADRSCPNAYGYMLTMPTWKLYSLGDTPKFISGDGNKMLRSYNADEIEVRLGYYAQLGCSKPGENAVITW